MLKSYYFQFSVLIGDVVVVAAATSVHNRAHPCRHLIAKNDEHFQTDFPDCSYGIFEMLGSSNPEKVKK